MSLHDFDHDVLLQIFETLYRAYGLEGARACGRWAATCREARGAFVQSLVGMRHYNECRSMTMTKIYPSRAMMESSLFPFTMQINTEKTSLRRIKGLHTALEKMGRGEYLPPAKPPKMATVQLHVASKSAQIVAMSSIAPFLFLCYLRRRPESFPRPRGDRTITHRVVVARLDGESRVEAPGFQDAFDSIEQLVPSSDGTKCAIVATDVSSGTSTTSSVLPGFASLFIWQVDSNTVVQVSCLDQRQAEPLEAWFSSDVLFVYWSGVGVVAHGKDAPYTASMSFLNSICTTMPFSFHVHGDTFAFTHNCQITASRFVSSVIALGPPLTRGSSAFKQYTLPTHTIYNEKVLTTPLFMAVSPNEQFVALLSASLLQSRLCVFVFRFDRDADTFVIDRDNDTIDFPAGDKDNGAKLRAESCFSVVWSPCSKIFTIVRRILSAPEELGEFPQYLYTICRMNGKLRRSKFITPSVAVRDISWSVHGLVILLGRNGALLLQ